jgi:hypothetical protein
MWGMNVGFDSSTLSVLPNGENLEIAGPSYIQMTIVDMKSYEVKELREIYGLIGDAVPGAGWMDTNDFVMTPDPCGMDRRFYLFGIRLTTGALKWRKDKSWMQNWGGKDGVLSLNGDNIVIAEEGTYNVMVDFNLNSYAITKTGDDLS